MWQPNLHGYSSGRARTSAAHVETVDKLPMAPPITAVTVAVAGADMVQVARAAKSAASTAQAAMLTKNVPSGSHRRRLQLWPAAYTHMLGSGFGGIGARPGGCVSNPQRDGRGIGASRTCLPSIHL